jgi:Xaa-Pro aminopeptidase
MTVPFPLTTYTARLNAVAALLAEQHIDAAVLTPGADLRFLLASDIDTHERFSALVITPTTRRIVVPAVDAAALRTGVAGAVGVEVVPWNDGDDALALAVGDLADSAATATVAVSGEMPANHLLNLQARGLTTVNATAVLRDVFMVKDEAEIAELRRAGTAIDEVHRQVPGLLRAGRTEREVAEDLEKLILAEHVTVDFIIVGSGPHGGDPHHDFSDRVIGDGEIVVIDIGGTLDTGYHSDCTRTYIVGPVGSARPDQTEAYRVLHDAQQAGLNAAKPGVTAHELDKVVRDVIDAAGYSGFYTHRTGHGIGLSGHEEPFIIAGNDLPLVEGMAFSIEPGIYIPGDWGARIEDIVVMTTDGCEPVNLTTHDLVPTGATAEDRGVNA